MQTKRNFHNLFIKSHWYFRPKAGTPDSRIRDDSQRFPLLGASFSWGSIPEFHGTIAAISLPVGSDLIRLIERGGRTALANDTDKGLQLKKRESAKMTRKKRVMLRAYLNQPLEGLRNNHARHEIGMGIFWVILAVVCGGLGWVLLTILLK